MNTLIVAALLATSAAPPMPWKLTAEDRAFLGGLFPALVDPVGAVRVSVPVLVREKETSLLRQVDEERFPEVRLWRLPPRSGGRSPVVVPDGREVIPMGGFRRIDFVEECRDILARSEGRVDYRVRHDSDTTRAAWLFRLGHEGLAAAFLSREGSYRSWQGLLHEAAHDAMIRAFAARADGEALASAEHLLRLYPAESREMKQVGEIAGDLMRRRKAGTFRLDRDFPPAGFAGWPAARRVRWLVESLEDVKLPPQPPESPMTMFAPIRHDKRFQALVQLGDAAVPALIEAVEKDTRLTRWDCSRVGGSLRSRVLLVSELALGALAEILQWPTLVEEMESGWELETEEGRRKMAVRLKAYWRRHGALSPVERLRARLLDPSSSFSDWESAARALAWGDLAVASRMIGYLPRNAQPRAMLMAPNKALALERPTAAEAILWRMDREMAVPPKDPGWREGEGVEVLLVTCLGCVARLNDPRILPALHRRFSRAEGAERLHLTVTCRVLGSSGPLEKIAGEVERGAFPGPGGDGEYLHGVVGMLSEADTPACSRALSALVRPKHPLHETARQNILGLQDDGPWLSHPFCLPILAGEMGEMGKTREVWTVIESGRTIKRARPGERGSWQTDTPGFLTESGNHHARADERRCDVAARRLSGLVAGMPEYNVLAKDAGSRLGAINLFLKCFAGRIRKVAEEELYLLNAGAGRPTLIPDIRPLGRAATEADVKAGRAVFHLGGKGRPMAFPPGSAIEAKGERGLVVQAETLGGAPVYGVIFRHSIRRVEAADVRLAGPRR